MSDELDTGRRFRTLGVIDICTREALAIEVDASLPGSRVVRGLDKWAAGNRIRLSFIEPGKLTDDAFVKSFNGHFREN